MGTNSIDIHLKSRYPMIDKKYNIENQILKTIQQIYWNLYSLYNED